MMASHQPVKCLLLVLMSAGLWLSSAAGAVTESQGAEVQRVTKAMAPGQSLDSAKSMLADASQKTAPRPYVSVEFPHWHQAAEARASLLGRIIAECPTGFNLVGERYTPRSMGKVELRLSYQCLR